MITTLSAYKEMVLSSSGSRAGNTSVKSAPASASGEQVRRVQPATGGDAVSVELSASHEVFSAVDDYFNLGRSGRFDAFHALSREDKEQFVKIVAELAKSGYMGYEELIVNKKVERHDMTNQIGNERLRDARVYDRPKVPRR